MCDERTRLDYLQLSTFLSPCCLRATCIRESQFHKSEKVVSLAVDKLLAHTHKAAASAASMQQAAVAAQSASATGPSAQAPKPTAAAAAQKPAAAAAQPAGQAAAGAHSARPPATSAPAAAAPAAATAPTPAPSSSIPSAEPHHGASTPNHTPSSGGGGGTALAGNVPLEASLQSLELGLELSLGISPLGSPRRQSDAMGSSGEGSLCHDGCAARFICVFFWR